jgi:glycerol-3-phosphate dehydrogenase
MFKDQLYDLFIIGGGVNGCGIARDAAGRGLKVYLCEQGDLAQGTSSSSTKLIHGGLRYLEHYEFRLVRESLEEREVLLKNAPHIISPLRFILPHKKDMRPAWLLRLGLFMYDHLGGREILQGTTSLNLLKDEAGMPLYNHFTRAFEYSDCWVDDARLVILNAIDAKTLGVDIQTQTKCISARRDNGIWRLQVEDAKSGLVREIKAKALVNASGPWVQDVMEECDLKFSNEGVRLVRGSHIIIKKMFDHERAYIFQNLDGRIFFAIPYEGNFTLIGTTDEDHKGSVNNVEITAEEIEYLCKNAGEYFIKKITPSDVIWSYSGVRPLYDDGASAAQEATRDYVLKIHGNKELAPVLNIFGGKITTYRRLAEAALAKLAPFFPHMKEPWTKKACLPGGDFPVGDVAQKVTDLREKYTFLDERWALRFIKMYGTRAWKLLDQANKKEDLGFDFGSTLTETEVMFMINEEWATSVEDILWRRSKLGLHMTKAQICTLEEKVKTFLDAKQSAA